MVWRHTLIMHPVRDNWKKNTGLISLTFVYPTKPFKHVFAHKQKNDEEGQCQLHIWVAFWWCIIDGNHV